MRAAVRYRSWLAVTLGGLVVTAWVALWWLERSPWGFLFHSHGGAHHHPPPELPPAVPGVLFVAGWTLMVVAMMLPSVFPVMEVFRRLVRRRQNRGVLLTALAAGYLLVWTLFGCLVYAAGEILTAIGTPWPPWAHAAVLFLLAGAFQFSDLKYRCLDRCRAPLGFVLARWWGGNDATRNAFQIGTDHGLFCIGCCWALMLLMFAAGTASLLWMLALGLVMAIEKNASWGRRLGKPLGVSLLAAGAALVLLRP